MNINWKVRMQSKVFWTSMVALLLVLANQLAGLFGYDLTVYSHKVTEISETILTILGLLGIIVDPTTVGLSDSQRALTYNKPKE